MRRHSITLSFLLASLSAASLAAADRRPPHHFDLPEAPVGETLNAIGRQTGVAIMFTPQSVEGLRSSPVNGDLSPFDAVEAALARSGLRAEESEGAILVRRRSEASVAVQDADATITVTGTRIRGSAPIGSPLTVITRDELEKSGRATIADMLQTLPQNFTGGPSEGNVGTSARNGAFRNSGYGASVNLRGLGTQSTLVLFDGNRPALAGLDGAFVDMSLIPATAIDRVEILSDGASAIYGTDAVAGVVNVRFRTQLEGLETKIYSGVGSNYHQRQLAQAVGHRWSSGHVLLAYQYDAHSRLNGADRGYVTADLRSHGGPDGRSTYGRPGTLVAADGSTFAIPVNDGRLSPEQLLPGTAGLTDQARTTDLIPRQRSHSVYAAVEQNIATGLSAYAHLLYANRRYERATLQTNLVPVQVPVANPYYIDPLGTRQPYSVQTNFAGLLGQFGDAGSVSGLSAAAGLKARLGSWSIEASGNYGHQLERDHSINAYNQAAIAQAVADPDPSTSLNLLGGPNNPATIAAIRGFNRNHNRYSVWSTALRADGNVIALPAGMVKLAVGYEHRDESFNSYETYSLYAPGVTRFQNLGTPATRRVDAVYGELSVPVFAASEGRWPGTFDATAAGRADWYSDVGRTINPKVGLRWAPTPDFALRASYATSFRAPSFTENYGTLSNSASTATLADPRSPTGFSNVLVLAGNADHLNPEKARSWTIGLDAHPRFAPGLTLTSNFFWIDYRDRLASPSAGYAQFLVRRDIYGSLVNDSPSAADIAALYSGRYFFNDIGIPASAVNAIIDLRRRNLSRQSVRGVDVDLRYAHAVAGGTGSVELSATRLFRFDDKITDTAPAAHDVATYGYPVRLKLRSQAGWVRGGLSVSAAVNYSSGYINYPTDYFGTALGTAEHVHSLATVDGQLGYEFPDAHPLHGVRIALSAVNLLDRKPPYMTNILYGSVLSYDPGQASPIGRLLSIQAVVKW